MQEWRRGTTKSFLRTHVPSLFVFAKVLRRYRWLFGITPEALELAMKVLHHLLKDQGYEESCDRGACVDGNGASIPWYTYPAIAFLERIDFTGHSVFEFGAGASTRWWAGRADRVTSVEHDPVWVAQLRNQLPNNCELILETDEDRYCEAVRNGHDVVVIDGLGGNLARLRCAESTLSRVGESALIVLDNSNWLPVTCEILRTAGFLQIDFDGPVPLSGDLGRTSVFLRRFTPRYIDTPVVGGVVMNWDSGASSRLPATSQRQG